MLRLTPDSAGSCFTAEGFEKACRELGVEHRKTRPYTPRTNGMVERFNGRVQREVLGITVASRRDLSGCWRSRPSTWWNVWPAPSASGLRELT
jgi:transposase InsO family protein